MATDLNALAEELRAAFPYGHPEFLPMLLEKMKLHSDKNHDYAKGGRPLGNFERVALLLGLYPGLRLDDPVVIMLIYALKQVDATLWGFAQGITQKVEGPIDRLGDVLVYAGIAICALKDRAKANGPITASEIFARWERLTEDLRAKTAERRDAPAELDAPMPHEPVDCDFCKAVENAKPDQVIPVKDPMHPHTPTQAEKEDIFRPEEKPDHRFPVHPFMYRGKEFVK